MKVVTQSSFPGLQIETEVGVTPGHFPWAVENDLRLIASGGIGSDLLELIDKRSRGIGTGPAEVLPGGTRKYPNVTIGYAPGLAETTARTHTRWKHYTRRKDLEPGQAFRRTGGGHYMWAYYRPNTPGTIDGENIYSQVAGIRTPPFIALAHELIHAWHGMSGTMETGKHAIAIGNGTSFNLSREEAYTVGLGPYANTRISENTIRAEHRLPRRDQYRIANDFAVFAPHPARPGHRPTGQELSAQLDTLRTQWNGVDDWW